MYLLFSSCWPGTGSLGLLLSSPEEGFLDLDLDLDLEDEESGPFLSLFAIFCGSGGSVYFLADEVFELFEIFL